MSSERANFGSKLGVILATAGSAVGLGNIWRFPYMAGQNGGAAFILIYIGCVLLLGIPCMVSECIIGRRGAANTARAYSNLAGRTPWRWIGFLGVLTGFLITSYYTVISGWCLQYTYAASVGELTGDKDYIQNYFATCSQTALRPILWTVSFMILTHFIVVRGIQKGIERASKILMPVLFVLLVVIVVAACLLPGAGEGIRFLLLPDLGNVDKQTFFGALGQSFYSLSIAMGCICTYASYYSRQTNLLGSALQVAGIDTLIAVMAGLIIFPAAFTVGIAPDSGPSLIFITLPHVFTEAFGGMPAVGYVVSMLFYALLALAALTTLISLHEVSTSFFCEELKISRQKAAVIVTVACCAIGALCSLSLGARPEWSIGGKPLFDVFDFVTGQVFLPIGGFLTCLFLGWYVPKRIVQEEFTNWGTIYVRLFPVYLFLIRVVCPLCIAAIMLYQFGIL